jgi:diaminobutyrate-2-oxoglutarate transaminase
LDFLKNVLENGFSGVCQPAAIILESVQGEGGIHIPPREYVQGLRRISADKGILLIFDEIQSGMARTGKMWACEHYGVTPDIMTASKSIGGAGIPLAAVFYKKELDKWPPGTCIGTFRGNVLGMAGGLGALDFIKETDLLTHVETISKVLNKGLNRLKDKYEVIGDVRQLGLMAAVEFVKDRETKEPWKEFLDNVLLECLKRGVLVWKAGYYFNVLRLLPPLIITEELINRALTVIEEAIDSVIKKNR